MSGHGVPHHAANENDKRIGIFIAVLAVVLAVVGALSNQQGNEMIVKEVKSSNNFAWYQAKRQRSYANELEIKRIEVELAGTPSDAQRKLLEVQGGKLTSKNGEYESENKEILKTAEEDRHEAEVASHKHHWFEYSEIALHIAVVLCSLMLLTNQVLFFRLGIAAAAAGVVIAVVAFTHQAEQPEHGQPELKHAAAAPAAH